MQNAKMPVAVRERERERESYSLKMEKCGSINGLKFLKNNIKDRVILSCISLDTG